MGKLAQHLVSAGVTEGVVDQFEVVHVEQDHTELRAIAQRAGQGRTGRREEMAAVVQSREIVHGRHFGITLLERFCLTQCALQLVGALAHQGIHVCKQLAVDEHLSQEIGEHLQRPFMANGKEVGVRMRNVEHPKISAVDADRHGNN